MSLVDAVELSRHVCQQAIEAELKYATDDNLIGRPVQGYTEGLTHVAPMTQRTAEQLCKVQNDLVSNHGYGLLVLDAYRPRQAVLDFLAWSKLPPANDYELERKQLHYPELQKPQLFELGYVAEDSNHCYGNTVDVMLVDAATKAMLSMGAIFDFMGERSHLTVEAEVIGEEAYRHRTILRQAMEKYGFEAYPYEFWHFSLFPREFNQPLDYAITPEWVRALRAYTNGQNHV